MHRYMRSAVALILLSGFIFLLVPQIGLSQSAISNITITDVDISEFPQVVVRFKPADNTGIPVANLSPANFKIVENSTQITPESLHEVEEGLWIHFVIDAGAGLTPARWENAKASILEFVQTRPWLKEDLDHIALTVVRASGPQQLVDFTVQSEPVVTAVEGFTPPGGSDFSAPLSTISTIVEDMAAMEGTIGQAKFVVLLSPRLETGGMGQVQNLGSKALELGIPVYTVLVREAAEFGPIVEMATPTSGGAAQPIERPGVDDTLVELAALSGGVFTHYQNNNSLNNAYNTLSQYRRQYDISYRSLSGESGSRQIQLSSEVGGGSVSDTTSYSVEVNPPRVLIGTPEAGDVIRRAADEYTDDRSSIAPTSQTVTASVIFPDDHLRRLRRATLLVNGQEAGSRENPGREFELNWNLRSVVRTGMNDFTLEIEVEDELGLVSVSPPVNVKVEVRVPPRPPSTPSPPIINDPSDPQIVSQIIPCLEITPEWLCDSVERPLRRHWVSVLSMVVSLSFAAFVWVNRNQTPVVAARQRITGALTTLTKKYKRSEAIAYLHVLVGDGNEGRLLEMYGDTPIGRSRQAGVDIVFHQYDENSPISRKHCTILNKEDHFMIRDEDSANGTFLNGVRLSPFEEHEIWEGDEIELAQVERGGVKLRLQLGRTEADISEDLRSTRPTRRPAADSSESDRETESFQDRF